MALINRSGRTALAVAATFVIIVGGCGGSDAAPSLTPAPTAEASADTAAASSAPADTAAPSTAVPASSVPASSVPATAVPAVTSPTVDMADTTACLTGTWVLVGDQVAGIFDQGAFAALPGLEVTIDGSGLLELSGDGTFVFTPDYAANITMEDTTGVGSWSGTQTGTWVVNGTTLAMAQTSNDIAGSLELFGSTVPLPAIGPFTGEAEIVSCDPATFTIEMATPVGAVQYTLVLAA